MSQKLSDKGKITKDLFSRAVSKSQTADRIIFN